MPTLKVTCTSFVFFDAAINWADLINLAKHKPSVEEQLLSFHVSVIIMSELVCKKLKYFISVGEEPALRDSHLSEKKVINHS